MTNGLNGYASITWKALAIVLGTALYGLVLWIASSTLDEVKGMRKDMAVVQGKNDVQDTRLDELDEDVAVFRAWMFPPAPRPSRGAGN